jgi:hypothetical protein
MMIRELKREVVGRLNLEHQHAKRRRPRRNGAHFYNRFRRGLRVGYRSRSCTARQKLERCALVANRVHEVREALS